MLKEYDVTKNILNIIRESKQVIFEESSNIIPITNDVKFGNGTLTQQENDFKNAVDSSVQFTQPDNNNPDSSPLVFIKDTGNVILSGTLPSLNNSKFQFSLRDSDGDGCFVWCEGLRLTESNLVTLKKLFGYYLNWRDDLEKNDEFFKNINS